MIPMYEHSNILSGEKVISRKEVENILMPFVRCIQVSNP